ncbi:MAG: tetraacyldisaccharide 4'-kinase, partial [Pseudomonadota bacterium]|nr:tetraacyldisaccharide 4'-kinase [Pseudomonadota bacterium]
MMKTPEHWNQRGPAALALLPLTPVWWLAGKRRQHISTVYRAPVPVICVCNLTARGAGKTPLVAWLFDQLTARGWRPVILSRGHGGSASRPLWVDPAEHDAAICGDEPLMLADGRDVLISKDRARGARVIAERGVHNVILMDDGMQNPYLVHDL